MVDEFRAVEYGKRFKSAMDAWAKADRPERTVHRVAEQLEITYQGVMKLAAGKVKAPGAYTNAKAAELFGVGPDWLAMGDPYPRERGKSANVRPLPHRPELPWPLDGVDEKAVRALDPEDRRRLADAVVIAAGFLNLSVASARSSRRANGRRP